MTSNSNMEKIILGELLKCYNICPEVDQVQICGDGREVSIEIKGKKLRGFASGVLAISHLASKAACLEKDEYVIYHWLSFCLAELFHCANSQDFDDCLKYLNSQLLDRAYLCGFRETIADVVVFLVLRPFITNWSYYQKEQYINISRWFGAIEGNEIFQGTTKDITFSKTKLYEDFSHLRF